jgi:phosphotransacetylase
MHLVVVVVVVVFRQAVHQEALQVLLQKQVVQKVVLERQKVLQERLGQIQLYQEQVVVHPNSNSKRH